MINAGSFARKTVGTSFDVWLFCCLVAVVSSRLIVQIFLTLPYCSFIGLLDRVLTTSTIFDLFPITTFLSHPYLPLSPHHRTTRHEYLGWTDAAILANASAVLKQLYPTSYVPYTKYLITRWQSDPYAKGSYSYSRVGSIQVALPPLVSTVPIPIPSLSRHLHLHLRPHNHFALLF